LKSQAGHLEGACGIASVIKAVLMLERGIIPPQGNFEKLNPKIPFTKWNFKVLLMRLNRREHRLNEMSIGSHK
jgi:acyl transferase domain-containing protein